MPHLLFVGLFFLALTTLLSAEEQPSVEDWISTAQQWSQLGAGSVILLESSGGSDSKEANHAGMAAILIDAPVENVWNVVNDQDKAPGYIKTLLSSELVEKCDTYSLIEQEVKVGFHKVKYVVKHVPEQPIAIHFKRDSGDLKEMGGYWRFFPIGEGEETKTLLIYRLSLKPDFPIPPFLIKKSLSDNLPDTLYSVKGEVLRLQKDS